MSMELEQVLPGEIERRSLEIITEELKGRRFDVGQEDIIKRVIHTTADFEYADTMTFSPDAVKCALEALRDGGNTVIVTDTNMTKAGITDVPGKLGVGSTATAESDGENGKGTRAYKGICKYGKGGSYGRGDWKTSDLFRGERTDGADSLLKTPSCSGEIYPALVVSVGQVWTRRRGKRMGLWHQRFRIL